MVRLVALSVLLLWAPFSLPRAEVVHEEKLIGWEGETYVPKEYPNGNGTIFLSNERPTPWIQTISWAPRAQVYHNFLSDAEARHIIRLAQHQMKRSSVVGPNNTGVIDGVRTSAGCFLRRTQDKVVAAVEERLAVWSQLPPIMQEEMQVLRYGPTNKYGAHIDGLERVMSVLIYLVAPEEGGETAFTDSTWSHPEIQDQVGKVSACAQGHVAYRPKRGDALLFYDVKADYLTEDGHSMHTGCPVIKGVKWNAVKWIHGKPYKPDEYQSGVKKMGQVEPADPGHCTNEEPRCDFWAQSGECEKNPAYMVGKGSGYGTCRKACKDCTVCKEGDQACMEENRRRGGFMSFDESEFGF